MCITFEHDELKPGVSGLLRVKNDGPFIRSCIFSCIDALDELIVVYNDCTDNSAEEIEKMRQLYPDKIKVYPYPYSIVRIFDAGEDGGLPTLDSIDPVHLLSNYYNFALSKVSYQCAVKIDADQLYFSDDFINITSLTKKCKSQFFLGYIVGGIMLKYKMKHTLKFMDSIFWWGYQSYAKYRFLNNHENLSLSGVNVLVHNHKPYVPIGGLIEGLCSFYPYNGVGDHLIFWVDKGLSYYEPYPIHRDVDKRYSVIERFSDNNKSKYHMGAYWFHRSMMRKACYNRVKEILNERQDIVIPFADFMKIENYKDVVKVLRKPFTASLYYAGVSVRYAHNYTKNRALKYIDKLEDANNSLNY